MDVVLLNSLKEDDEGVVTSSPASEPVRVTVEFFGVSRLMTKTKTITINMAPEATLGQVFSALVQIFPVLAGRVIDAGTSGLSAGQSCNINGQNFVHDPNTRIDTGDHIFILSADAGG